MPANSWLDPTPICALCLCIRTAYSRKNIKSAGRAGSISSLIVLKPQARALSLSPLCRLWVWVRRYSDSDSDSDSDVRVGWAGLGWATESLAVAVSLYEVWRARDRDRDRGIAVAQTRGYSSLYSGGEDSAVRLHTCPSVRPCLNGLCRPQAALVRPFLCSLGRGWVK